MQNLAMEVRESSSGLPSAEARPPGDGTNLPSHHADRGSIATLQEFVDMAAKDQEHFHSSMRIKDKAITDLERKLVDSHARLQNLLLKEGWLQSKVRQGNPMKEAACAYLYGFS